MNKEEKTTTKAIALCFKPYLKPEEAQIYCNLGATQFAKNMAEYGITKTPAGYFRKVDLDRFCEGVKTI